MTDLNDLVGKIRLEIDAIAEGIVHETLSMRDFDRRKRKVGSICGQIFNRGRIMGWDEHVVMVRERINEISLTDKEMSDLPVPEVEPF